MISERVALPRIAASRLRAALLEVPDNGTIFELGGPQRRTSRGLPQKIYFVRVDRDKAVVGLLQQDHLGLVHLPR